VLRGEFVGCTHLQHTDGCNKRGTLNCRQAARRLGFFSCNSSDPVPSDGSIPAYTFFDLERLFRDPNRAAHARYCRAELGVTSRSPSSERSQALYDKPSLPMRGILPSNLPRRRESYRGTDRCNKFPVRDEL
jgi:hypothetical protein